jgi:hypothetical protein
LLVVSLGGCAPPDEPFVPREFRAERAVYLTSVGETVRLVKTPSAGWVEFADGGTGSLGWALEAEHNALRERFGAIDDRLRERLAHAAQGERIPVAVKYHRQGSVAATETEALAVKRLLEDEGGRILGQGRVATFVFAEATPRAIERVARDARVAMVYLDERVAATVQDASYVVPYTLADTVMYPINVTGRTQTVGYIGPAARRWSRMQLRRGSSIG